MSKKDVLVFSDTAEQDLLKLHLSLKNKSYCHGTYHTFILCDPKRRIINKASVADRVIHHAIVRVFEPFYDRKFIHRSYASRKGKGLHKGVRELKKMVFSATRNDTRRTYYLKCDIKKFFDSVDHHILTQILKKDIKDGDTLGLFSNIIESFHVTSGKALPLGNYTSQLFANIYMNEFDQYIKRILHVKYYIRYSDDFVILSSSKEELLEILEKIQLFLDQKLNLKLHQKKIVLHKVLKGIDFLGYVIFPHYIILRTRTKKRIMKKLQRNPNLETLTSYIGMTKHAHAHTIRRTLLNIYTGIQKETRNPVSFSLIQAYPPPLSAPEDSMSHDA